MATTTDSPSNHQATASAGFSGENNSIGSPNFRRSNLPSPWAKVVRGESEAIDHHSSPSSSSSLSSLVASLQEQNTSSDCSPSRTSHSSPPPPANSVTESSDAYNSNAAAQPKKLAWNKPSNGVVENGPVIDAVSWPALSESARASPKLPTESSSKPTVDGSVLNHQGPVNLHSSQKQAATGDGKPNPTSNHSMPARQRPSKRGSGGSNGSKAPRGGFHHPSSQPQPQPYPIFPMPPNSYGSMIPAPPDPNPRDRTFPGDNWDNRPTGGGFVPHPRPVNDHHSSSRRGNFSPHVRGDGSSHNNRARHDQERGSYSNAREARMQQQRPPPRGFGGRPSPPPHGTPYAAPQPGRPFGNPTVFPEFFYVPTLPFEPFRGMPMMPPPAVFLPVPEPPLSTLLVNQIDFYFSDDNLVKDNYLRSKMDDQGWVPISLIASFPRVRNLTNNTQLILHSLRSSSIVEVQDYMVRRRNDWSKWIPPRNRPATDSDSVSPGGPSIHELATSFNKIAVDEAGGSQINMSGQGGHISNAGHSQLPNGQVTHNTTSQN